MLLPQKRVDDARKNKINHAQKNRHRDHDDQNDHGGVNELLTGGPGDLTHLGLHFTKKLRDLSNHLTTSLPLSAISHERDPHPAVMQSQARRDSNPQQAVLETAALPIGATGLKISRTRTALFELFVRGVLPAMPAELLQLQTSGAGLLVLGAGVGLFPARRAFKLDEFSHGFSFSRSGAVTSKSP
jgi:hypothetical protein